MGLLVGLVVVVAVVAVVVRGSISRPSCSIEEMERS